MNRNYAPIAKLFYMGVLVACIYWMMELAYGWSLAQTAVFGGAVTGDGYAMTFAWLIQLGPQALFTVAGFAALRGQKRLALALSISGFALNGIDMFTNYVTYKELWPTLSASLYARGRTAEFVNATYPVGVTLAVSITWAEELALLAAATVLLLFVEFADAMRWRLHPQFRNFVEAGARIARNAGGDSRPRTGGGGGGGDHRGAGGGGHSGGRPSYQTYTPDPRADV